jgi:hypothetical protein
MHRRVQRTKLQIYHRECYNSRSQWPRGLGRGYRDRGTESRSRYGCLFSSFGVVPSCVGRGLGTGRSPVEEKRYKNLNNRGGLGSPRTAEPQEKSYNITIIATTLMRLSSSFRYFTPTCHDGMLSTTDIRRPKQFWPKVNGESLLGTVTSKMTAFWDTGPSSVVEVGQSFRAAYYYQGDDASSTHHVRTSAPHIAVADKTFAGIL